ncbi:hypothetical protein F5880DRAFT_1259283 [Lentinula raphanica]|nr:hypothetical protein F5880DRAFT_1259283 [Lentinula raphanica]
MSAESSRRVITFLPPPLESKRQTPPRNNHGNVCIDSPEELAHAGEVLSLHVHQSNQLESDWDSGSYHGEKKFAALLRNTPNPYPSPHASTLLTDDCSPSETNIGHAATKAHSVAIPYRPPSPPTSDPPEQSRNGKTALLDMKDISRQYQATRTMVRKVCKTRIHIAVTQRILMFLMISSAVTSLKTSSMTWILQSVGLCFGLGNKNQLTYNP